MRKPVYILQREDEVKDIVNLAAIAVVEAQRQSKDMIDTGEGIAMAEAQR